MKFIHFLICAILLFAFFCLPVTASAHSGRTDSNGGHTNSQTGEYHYHHGYPAHQHYDMNGDEKPDCPYTFKNNTSSDTSSKTNDQASASLISTEIIKNEDSSEIGILWLVIGYLVFFGFVLYKYRNK